jgi:hypothetical protein
MEKRNTLVRCPDTGAAVHAATTPPQAESFFASGNNAPPMCPGGGPRPLDAAAVSNAHHPQRAGDAELAPEHALRVDAEVALTLDAVHNACGSQLMEWNTNANTCSSRIPVFMPL